MNLFHILVCFNVLFYWVLSRDDCEMNERVVEEVEEVVEIYEKYYTKISDMGLVGFQILTHFLKEIAKDEANEKCEELKCGIYKSISESYKKLEKINPLASDVINNSNPDNYNFMINLKKAYLNVNAKWKRIPVNNYTGVIISDKNIFDLQLYCRSEIILDDCNITDKCYDGIMGIPNGKRYLGILQTEYLTLYDGAKCYDKPKPRMQKYDVQKRLEYLCGVLLQDNIETITYSRGLIISIFFFCGAIHRYVDFFSETFIELILQNEISTMRWLGFLNRHKNVPNIIESNPNIEHALQVAGFGAYLHSFFTSNKIRRNICELTQQILKEVRKAAQIYKRRYSEIDLPSLKDYKFLEHFLKDIPKEAIIKKCDESKYGIYNSILKIYKKFKKINRLASDFRKKSDPFYYNIMEKKYKAYLNINATWKNMTDNNYTGAKMSYNQILYYDYCMNDILSKDCNITDSCYDGILGMEKGKEYTGMLQINFLIQYDSKRCYDKPKPRMQKYDVEKRLELICGTLLKENLEGIKYSSEDIIMKIFLCGAIQRYVDFLSESFILFIIQKRNIVSSWLCTLYMNKMTRDSNEVNIMNEHATQVAVYGAYLQWLFSTDE